MTMGRTFSRWARKTDRNHAEIRAALRAAGWHVTDLFRVGQGVPDLLAAKPRCAVLVEVKMPGEPLTADESKFHADYPGPAVVAFSGQDAVTQCGLIFQAVG